MRPPVLCATSSVQLKRHNTATRLRITWRERDDAVEPPGVEGSFEKLRACDKSKPCYNRARLDGARDAVKQKMALQILEEPPEISISRPMASSTKAYLKIGDVARMVGVSPSVIRSWESLGLTRPRRTESKYRLYTPEDIKLLKRARFLRRVRGLNAPAIVQLLKRDGQVRVVPDGAARAIGVRLRQLRTRRGLSLAQASKAVG